MSQPSHGVTARHRIVVKIALGAATGTVLIRSADAYVDPNSAGPLYQFLFPLFVAIASLFAVVRRAVVRFWKRLTGRRSPDTGGCGAMSFMCTPVRIMAATTLHAGRDPTCGGDPTWDGEPLLDR
jgi:hypothetical protein